VTVPLLLKQKEATVPLKNLSGRVGHYLFHFCSACFFFHTKTSCNYYRTSQFHDQELVELGKAVKSVKVDATLL